MEVLVAWRAKQLLRKVTKNSCCSGEETEDESYLTYTLYDINKVILTNLEECVWISVLPLINKSEFAIHGIACDELSGFDLDFSINLRRALGVDSPHSHQAAEVRAIMFVCLTLSLCSQLAARPAAHVACTVDRAVLLRLCRQKHKKHESTYSIPVHQIGEPLRSWNWCLSVHFFFTSESFYITVYKLFYWKSLHTFLFRGAGLKFLLFHFDRNFIVLHAAEERAPCAWTQPRGTDWNISLDLHASWIHERIINALSSKQGKKINDFTFSIY